MLFFCIMCKNIFSKKPLKNHCEMNVKLMAKIACSGIGNINTLPKLEALFCSKITVKIQ